MSDEDLLCSHRVKGVKELYGVSCIKSPIPFMRCLPSWHNHFPKSLPLNTITLGIIEIINLVGMKLLSLSHNLILGVRVKFCQCCWILVVRNKSLGTKHIQRDEFDYTRYEYKKAGMVGSHFRSCLPQVVRILLPVTEQIPGSITPGLFFCALLERGMGTYNLQAVLYPSTVIMDWEPLSLPLWLFSAF